MCRTGFDQCQVLSAALTSVVGPYWCLGERQGEVVVGTEMSLTGGGEGRVLAHARPNNKQTSTLYLLLLYTNLWVQCKYIYARINV